jgi:hypothetical protein
VRCRNGSNVEWPDVRARPGYLSWMTLFATGSPRFSTSALLENVRAPEPESPMVFLHRDFHPGNLLWHKGELVGIVDWAFACRGPGAVDVAHTRANLALVDGVTAADRFLEAYGTQMPPHTDTTHGWTLQSSSVGAMISPVSSPLTPSVPISARTWCGQGQTTTPERLLRHSRRYDGLPGLEIGEDHRIFRDLGVRTTKTPLSMRVAKAS